MRSLPEPSFSKDDFSQSCTTLGWSNLAWPLAPCSPMWAPWVADRLVVRLGGEADRPQQERDLDNLLAQNQGSSRTAVFVPDAQAEACWGALQTALAHDADAIEDDTDAYAVVGKRTALGLWLTDSARGEPWLAATVLEWCTQNAVAWVATDRLEEAVLDHFDARRVWVAEDLQPWNEGQGNPWTGLLMFLRAGVDDGVVDGAYEQTVRAAVTPPWQDRAVTVLGRFPDRSSPIALSVRTLGAVVTEWTSPLTTHAVVGALDEEGAQRALDLIRQRGWKVVSPDDVDAALVALRAAQEVAEEMWE